MPTVLRDGPFRFFFFAGDRAEPPHIHVERDIALAKFWLNPVRLDSSRGFARVELRQVQKIIEQHHHTLLGAWNDYFGT